MRIFKKIAYALMLFLTALSSFLYALATKRKNEKQRAEIERDAAEAAIQKHNETAQAVTELEQKQKQETQQHENEIADGRRDHLDNNW